MFKVLILDIFPDKQFVGTTPIHFSWTLQRLLNAAKVVFKVTHSSTDHMQHKAYILDIIYP